MSAVLKCEYKEPEIKMLTAISRDAPLPSSNKKLIRRWDSQMWLDDIDGDMPDSPVWPPLPVYLATLEESHSHTPVREICSEGGDWRTLGRSSWFLVGELPNGQAIIWSKNTPEKLNPLSMVHVRDRQQTRQTTDRQTNGYATPLAKHNVVTFG